MRRPSAYAIAILVITASIVWMQSGAHEPELKQRDRDSVNQDAKAQASHAELDDLPPLLRQSVPAPKRIRADNRSATAGSNAVSQNELFDWRDSQGTELGGHRGPTRAAEYRALEHVAHDSSELQKLFDLDHMTVRVHEFDAEHSELVTRQIDAIMHLAGDDDYLSPSREEVERTVIIGEKRREILGDERYRVFLLEWARLLHEEAGERTTASDGGIDSGATTTDGG